MVNGIRGIETMNARTFKREPVDRDIRTAKYGSAREAVGDLVADCEIYVLTYGQFSLIDALVAILDQTGPAYVDLATWTAASADLRTMARLLEGAAIGRMRYVVDGSFLTRQPEYCTVMRDLFGDDCIRTTKMHGKFATIRNAEWSLAIRTSMNLNTNPRLENIEISDDPALCAFLTTIVDEIYSEQPVGLFDQTLPKLESLPNTTVIGGVQVGRVSV